MTKYRIYEIAKELNLDNKKVLGFLADHKITVKNHMSTVEAGVRDMIVKGLKANQGSVKEAAQNAARKVQEKAAQAAAPVAAKVAQVKSDIAVGKAAIQAHHAAQQKPAQESRNDRNDRRNDGRGENRGHDRNGQNHSERRGDRLQNSQNGQNRDNGRRNDRSQNGQNRSNGNGSSRFGRNDRNGGNQNRSGNGGNNRNKPQNGRAGKPGAPIGGNSAHAGKDMGKRNNNHNHPTEIEPFGGAATCLGGAIRDPLSGRSYVYQAMRVTGAGNPLVPVEDTITGKLPQRKIVFAVLNRTPAGASPLRGLGVKPPTYKTPTRHS